jgi:redox-sensitive bicupin YhaK (pirin superfamily)
MLAIRRANDRGLTDIDWLYSRHTFSFGDYIDPKHHNYRSLRVINDDVIGAGGGFPLHPHRDMEILTYVMSGRLEHRDSMGNGTVIGPGEWQKMSAGTGIRHSEFNPSDTEPVHLLQIWIHPTRKNLTPEYDQKLFPESEKLNRWRVIASPDGRDGSIRVHQDAILSAAGLRESTLTHSLADGRGAWLHVAKGTVTVNGESMMEGDAAAIEGEPIVVSGNGEVLLFDLK